MIAVFTTALLMAEFGQVWESKCVMTSHYVFDRDSGMSSLVESRPDLPNCVIARQLGNPQNNIRYISISHHAKLIMNLLEI